MKDDVWQAPGRGAAGGEQPPADRDRWRPAPGASGDDDGTGTAGTPAPYNPYATPAGDSPAGSPGGPGRYAGPAGGRGATGEPGRAPSRVPGPARPPAAPDAFAMPDRHREKVLGAAGYTTPAYRNDAVAVTALVLGIVGIVVPGVCLFAIAAGHLALRRLRTSYDGGRGLAVAGLVMGYVTLALWASLLLLTLGTGMMLTL